MRAASVAFCIAFFATICQAQQPAHFSLFRDNLSAFNPAYTGSDGQLVAGALVRQQWTGLSEAPQTQFLQFELPFEAVSSGLGLTLQNDRLGLQQNVQGALAYSFFLRTGKESRLSAGIRAGLGSMNWNGSEIRTPEGNYSSGATEHRDVILPNISFAGQYPILDAGVMYQRNFVKLGFGVKNLANSSFRYTINNGKIRLVTNYFFTFATELEIGEHFRLMPAVLFRSDFIENQLDVATNFEFFRKFDAGLGFRGWSSNSRDAVYVMAGLKLSENFRILYAYDFNLSPLRNSNSGSHELMLQYRVNTSIGKATPERVIYNARYY